MGWTAARNELGNEGWALFAILAFWQLPHFFAIAWMYRDEYAKAGFVMLPNVDADGTRTGQQAVSNTIALMIVSLCPYIFGISGRYYLVSALVLGVGFLFFAIQFSRQLFFVSIIYLPLLLAAMCWDKLK
jgi:protoheme IX farnesyltransferase